MKNKAPPGKKFKKPHHRRPFYVRRDGGMRFILTLLAIGGLLIWAVAQGELPSSPSTAPIPPAPQKTTAPAPATKSALASLECTNPYVFDGDTFDCGGRRIRLSSIDAPEMSGHCAPGRKCVAGDPVASKNYLRKITRGTIQCKVLKTDHYNRLVAQCFNAAGNIECDMVRRNHAVQRYGRLSCPD